MKLIRFLNGVSAACAMTAAMASPAMADNIVVDSTGPGSIQAVSVTDSSTVSTANTSIVHIANNNTQASVTGDVAASRNTSIGSAIESGDAVNSSSTTAVVVVSGPVLPPAIEAEIDPSLSNDAVLPGSQMTPETQPTSVQVLGNVLGASIGGLGAGAAAVLPSVGASFPIDVSALRDAWWPQGQAPTVSLARQMRGVTAGMLAAASALSLIGAIGSIVRARRKQGEI